MDPNVHLLVGKSGAGQLSRLMRANYVLGDQKSDRAAFIRTCNKLAISVSSMISHNIFHKSCTSRASEEIRLRHRVPRASTQQERNQVPRCFDRALETGLDLACGMSAPLCSSGQFASRPSAGC